MNTANVTYTIENYGKKPTFASFLPGISGEMGIPIWCYYVNRGQTVSCFGIEDKDHSIMEFTPAHQAFMDTKRKGFRTFIKVDNFFYEPFADESLPHSMTLEMNALILEEINEELGIKTKVIYQTLPMERLGGLVRKVTVTNLLNKDINVEIVDGMPALLPVGIDQENTKNMLQTAKAWMQVENLEEKLPYYRLRQSLKDSAQVKFIEEGNFGICTRADGSRVDVIADPQVLFEYDYSFEKPYGFIKGSAEQILEKHQVTMNQVPCCFFVDSKKVKQEDNISLFEIFGQAENTKCLADFVVNNVLDEEYFNKKLEFNRKLAESIARNISTKTSNEVFDAYCGQDFLDNVLRGGMPIKLGEKELFYMYARKHGDMERDYNYFRISPEYFSQGNGNYRDINQNRRCDNAFYSYVKDQNIHMFMDYIQLDGYNPLSVEKVTYKLSQKACQEVSKIYDIPEEEISEFKEAFTPGALAMKLESLKNLSNSECLKCTGEVLDLADKLPTSEFLEGYWCDHFSYNLDLIENYLRIYPEKEEELLFEQNNFYYHKMAAKVLPRKLRYVKTDSGIRQYNFLEELDLEGDVKMTTLSDGAYLSSSLFAKYLLLIGLKVATLDPYGIGIEMEGGKPGWYDALNGLPGLIGSSTAETSEILRLIIYIKKLVAKYKRDVYVLEEVSEFLTKIQKILSEGKSNGKLKTGKSFYDIWDKMNDAKESYRDKIYEGISERYSLLADEQILNILECFEDVIKSSVLAAVEAGDGLIVTYFYYSVENYEEKEDGIIPTSFLQHTLPHFLEGVVHYMKLPISEEEKEKLYEKVHASELYDKKLNMLRVNASLDKEIFEIGRCRAFVPGWLENGSIWLHMEYKYLLELIKSAQYNDFFKDFHTMAIPFVSQEMYGRSPLENSSFLVSSAYPDESIHGRGFVSRLSGSTVEFMDIWQRMFFGNNPFRYEDGELVLEFTPAIPAYLHRGVKQVSAMFMGRTEVIYEWDGDIDIIPGKIKIQSYTMTDKDNVEKTVNSKLLYGEDADRVRNGNYTKVHIRLCAV